MANALERRNLQFEIAADRAPTDKQRADFGRRVSELTGYLAPGKDEEIAIELKRLFDYLAAKETNVDSQIDRIVTYTAVLAGPPLSSIRRAVFGYLRGEFGDGKWMPKPGELRNVVLKIAEPHSLERARISKILSAKVLPPENPEARETAMRHVRETLRQLDVTAASDRQYGRPSAVRPDPWASRQGAEEYLASVRDLPPPSLGYGLQKQFGLLVGQKVESDPVHEDQAEAR